MTAVEELSVAAPESRGQLSAVLLAMIAVAVAAIAVAGGYFWGASGSDDAASMPATTSVDAGFARDMSTHHAQAVTMAGAERDTTTDPVSSDWRTTSRPGSSSRSGSCRAGLDVWGLSRSTTEPQMAWMGGEHMHMPAGEFMPGMATAAEVTQLQQLRRTALDIGFLQLMIRHHQGGVEMARYAGDHAGTDYVRTLARSMVAAQSSEIIAMEQSLRELGASPLPAPSS